MQASLSLTLPELRQARQNAAMRQPVTTQAAWSYDTALDQGLLDAIHRHPSIYWVTVPRCTIL